MPTPPKLVVPLILTLMLFVAVPSASASSVTTTHQTVRETVTWAMSAQCPSLPAGVSLTGAGQRNKQINTTTNADGSQTISTNDLVTGVASDSNGGSYRFIYHNHSINNAPASGFPIHVNMVDSFVLNGSGSIGHLEVGFNWSWDYNGVGDNFPPGPGITNWQKMSTRNTVDCDPL